MRMTKSHSILRPMIQMGKKEAGKHNSQKYQLVSQFFKKEPGKLKAMRT